MLWSRSVLVWRTKRGSAMWLGRDLRVDSLWPNERGSITNHFDMLVSHDSQQAVLSGRCIAPEPVMQIPLHLTSLDTSHASSVGSAVTYEEQLA